MGNARNAKLIAKEKIDLLLKEVEEENLSEEEDVNQANDTSIYLCAQVRYLFCLSFI